MQLKTVSKSLFFEYMYREQKGIMFVNHAGPKWQHIAVVRESEQLIQEAVGGPMLDVRTNQMFNAVSFARWFTPNLFNLPRFGRTKRNLQYIQVFALEFDINIISPLEVVDRLDDAGLPQPHFIVASKTEGHWHVYWMIEPVSAYTNVVAHVDRITEAMAKVTGADLQGVGAERWFAVPKREIYMLQNINQIYTYDTFKDWYEIYLDTYPEERLNREPARILKMDIFGHPAIQKLMKGTFTGQRDHACFTLALVYYSQNWEKEATLEELIKWNDRNEQQGHNFTQHDVQKCVESAYSGKYKGPKSSWIEKLTGVEFKLRVMRPRENKNAYKKLEQIEYKLLQFIRAAGKKGLECSQKEIAKQIDCPERSVKKALKKLIEEQRIIKIGGGPGRGNIATYKLVNHDAWDSADDLKGANYNTVISLREAWNEVAVSLELDPCIPTFIDTS